MKKLLLATLLCLATSAFIFAQDQKTEGAEESKGFKKENLFTGGSISLSFGTGSILVGASPVFGYSFNNWLDAGAVVNYTYQAYRDVDYYGYGSNDRIKQSIYGGGAFVKIYPVKFLFVQGQFEHNFVSQKYIYASGQNTDKLSYDVNSTLVGAGYCAGRFGAGGQPFFYLSVLFDVSGNRYSPYVNCAGNAIPLIRAGIQVPLFQGKDRNNYDNEDRSDTRDGKGKRPHNYNRY